MDKAIVSFIDERRSEFDLIIQRRKDDLTELAKLIHSEIKVNNRCQITIICTHNSRRSQLAEFLLRMIAHELNIDELKVFSGGTEATAFNYRMVVALENLGFEFDKSNDVSNPKYSFLSDRRELAQIMFSKIYNDLSNPQSSYIAVMVCDHADENCPIVIGASHRFSLPYIDPKVSDDTTEEAKTYRAKVEEIGREMLFLCEIIKGRNLTQRN